MWRQWTLAVLITGLMPGLGCYSASTMPQGDSSSSTSEDHLASTTDANGSGGTTQVTTPSSEASTMDPAGESSSENSTSTDDATTMEESTSSGETGDSCQANEVACENSCIDPMTDDLYCGAQADCEGPNVGIACGIFESCVSGSCSFTIGLWAQSKWNASQWGP